MIRPAKIDDIPYILELTRACAADLRASEIFQWNDAYPSREIFENDLQREELYVLTGNGEIRACIVVTSTKDEEYEEIAWTVPEGRHVYIHRLAVHPNLQGNGLAGKLMDFAEQKASEAGCDSVRLDTFSQNPRSNALYQRRGYVRCGHIFLPLQSDLPFHCYELPL